MKTKQRILLQGGLGILVLLMVSSCKFKENEKLRVAIDSLETELQTSVEVAQTLHEVGILIDSIDVNRQLLTTGVIEGTSYTNYTERLSDINAYVKQTARKITAMEETLRKSKSNNSYYASTIRKLKNELESRSTELVALQQEVEKVRVENAQLTETVRLNEDELGKKTEIIQLNQQSIASMERRIDEIVKQASVDQADSYFKQAQALETAAQRTKFAPRKKKATAKEALELYKLAAMLGKTEAEIKIAKLEKSL